MARSLLTPHRRKVICEAIAMGCPWDQAARAAGVSPRTLSAWRTKGYASEKGPHRALVDALETAEAEGMRRNLAVIDEAAQKGDWKAAAWRLERRHPREFGRNRHTPPPEVTAAQQAEIAEPPQLTLDVMGATWIRALQVAEAGYKRGELSVADYLRTVTGLSGLAGRAIEIASRQTDAAEVPPLEISVSLDSPHMVESANETPQPGVCGDPITVQ